MTLNVKFTFQLILLTDEFAGVPLQLERAVGAYIRRGTA
jgi:hypothetical protein